MLERRAAELTSPHERESRDVVVERAARRVPGARLWSRCSREYGTHAKILNGSIILLIGSIFVSLANFGYNIGVARMLGPVGLQSCSGGGHHTDVGLGA